MMSLGNAASCHSGLIPLKTVYKKRGELLRAIASKNNFLVTCIQLLLLQFLHVIWSMPTNFEFFKNRSIIFFINLTIPRSIV